MLRPLSFERNPVIATLALVVVVVTSVIVAKRIRANNADPWSALHQARARHAATALVLAHDSAIEAGVRIHARSLDQLIELLAAGVVVDDCASPIYGKRLSIGTLPDQALADAHKYLRFDARSGEFEYVPAGQPATESRCD